MSSIQMASLVLRTSDLTVNAANQCGTVDQYRTTCTWNNINLRTVLGDLFDKYDTFNLCLNTVTSAVADNTVGVANDDRSIIIKMSGLPFINQTYSVKQGCNTNTCAICSFTFTRNVSTYQFFDNYGLLAKMLFDLQQSTDACYGRQNELVGTRNDLVSSITTPAAFAATTTSYLTCNQINSGEGFNFAVGTTVSTAGNLCDVVINATTPRYYCLNLISILGSLNSQNYFPLFACTSAPIRIEIQLVANI